MQVESKRDNKDFVYLNNYYTEKDDIRRENGE